MALPSFTTRFEDNLLLADDANLVFGTCAIGSTFGQVKSATLKKVGDYELITQCSGNMRAALIRNPRFELQLETLYSADVTLPTFGDAVTFPLGSITGYVFGDIEIKWEEKGSRMLSFSATSWDANPTLTRYYYDISAPHDWAEFTA